MNIAGIDLSTFHIDIVKLPLEDGAPDWTRLTLTGHDAFDRTPLLRVRRLLELLGREDRVLDAAPVRCPSRHQVRAGTPMTGGHQ